MTRWPGCDSPLLSPKSGYQRVKLTTTNSRGGHDFKSQNADTKVEVWNECVIGFGWRRSRNERSSRMKVGE